MLAYQERERRPRPKEVSIDPNARYEEIYVGSEKRLIHRKLLTSDLCEIPVQGASSSFYIEIKQGMWDSFMNSEFNQILERRKGKIAIYGLRNQVYSTRPSGLEGIKKVTPPTSERVIKIDGNLVHVAFDRKK